jgi:tRNA threonylcarbamoyladenosine biosynthesis protein TsaE
MEFIVKLDALDQFANQFWNLAGSNRIFAFHGEMGAGKTTIIEALCKAKGVKEGMSSPTFSIINEYVYDEAGKENIIYHMDLYRLKDEEETIQAGVEDSVFSGHTCFVEWPEKAPGIFDHTTTHVHIEQIDETGRKVLIKLPPVV